MNGAVLGAAGVKPSRVSASKSWASSDATIGDDTWRFIRFDTVGGPTVSDVGRNVWNLNTGVRVLVRSMSVMWTGQVPSDVKMGIHRVVDNFSSEALVWETDAFSPVVRTPVTFRPEVVVEPEWPMLVGIYVPVGSVAPSNFYTRLTFEELENG